MATLKESKRLRTALYFHRRSGPAFQEVARRIRAEKVQTILVWANKFRGPESMIEHIHAVVIQKSCTNAEKIGNAYASFGNNVEIHYTDDDGEFIDSEAPPDPATDEGSQEDVDIPDEVGETDSAVQVEAAADEDDSEADGDEELDARSDEKFFEDSTEADAESTDEVGSTDSEFQK